MLNLDSTLESFVFELTGTSPKIDAFINLMLALGRVEVSRTGVAAIARGEKVDMEVTGITPTRRQKPVRRIGK